MKVISKSVTRDELGQRVTTYVFEGARREPKPVYAICVESDGPEYLTLSKVYRVKFFGEDVVVTDDQGEATVYPASFFVQVRIPKEAHIRLESVLAA